jgi:ketosteroid isomerase-like protein
MAVPEIVETLRAAYRRWNDTRGQSVTEWFAMMADDVKLRSVADGAEGMEFSAPRDGKAALEGYFAALAADWEMVYHAADQFLADGDMIVVFGRCAFKHRRTGKTAETPLIHRWLFRDGLVAEFYEYYDTARAFAAATPDPT